MLLFGLVYRLSDSPFATLHGDELRATCAIERLVVRLAPLDHLFYVNMHLASWYTLSAQEIESFGRRRFPLGPQLVEVTLI